MRALNDIDPPRAARRGASSRFRTLSERLAVGRLAGLHACIAAAQAEIAVPEVPKDRYLITVAPAAADPESSGQPDAPRAPTSARPGGRLILFFTPDTPRWAGVEPADAPFFEKPQPIHSIAVGAAEARDGSRISFDAGAAASFGLPLDEMEGLWRVQAVLDIDFTARGHLGPGNLVSEVQSIDLSSTRADDIEIALTRVVPAEPPQADEESATDAPNPNLVWISRKSELLSRHFGRPIAMRAGVVLPYGYHDLDFARRVWPTIYVIPGFGGTHRDAARAAGALSSRQAQAAVPQAVWVYLDAETAWGHHGFCDSETNGPVGRALVEEFVPFLEERFRLVPRTEARLATGHSSGGWTALHLATTYPETFGACFASAPDPVDFSAFQRTNLYREPNLFVARDGTETPSHRVPLAPTEDRVTMTVRDEIAAEHAIDPEGRSGEQWAAWDAMWSPLDPQRNAPRRLCDPATGEIDLIAADRWSRHDLARRFEKEPDKYGPILAERVRLVCGTRDSFYLNEAVARLKAKLDAWRAAKVAKGEKPPTGPGFIELLEGLTHDGAAEVAQIRFHKAMREHLFAHDLAEDPLPAGRVPPREPNDPSPDGPKRDTRPAAPPR
jgi:hypothetical protein